MFSAVVDTLEKTDIGLGSIPCAIKLESCSFCGVLMLLVKAELGLDGGTVDAETVKTLPGPFGKFHVLLATVRVNREGYLNVHTSNELCVGELPDVDVVAGDDSG